MSNRAEHQSGTEPPLTASQTYLTLLVMELLRAKTASLALQVAAKNKDFEAPFAEILKIQCADPGFAKVLWCMHALHHDRKQSAKLNWPYPPNAEQSAEAILHSIRTLRDFLPKAFNVQLSISSALMVCAEGIKEAATTGNSNFFAKLGELVRERGPRNQDAARCGWAGFIRHLIVPCGLLTLPDAASLRAAVREAARLLDFPCASEKQTISDRDLSKLIAHEMKLFRAEWAASPEWCSAISPEFFSMALDSLPG